MSKTVILDNGHGGMINNEYQTAGKRSSEWSQGILYALQDLSVKTSLQVFT